VSVDGKLIVGRSDNNGVAASALGRDEEGADTRGSDTTRNSTLSLIDLNFATSQAEVAVPLAASGYRPAKCGKRSETSSPQSGPRCVVW
jgi:hypothetical protein